MATVLILELTIPGNPRGQCLHKPKYGVQKRRRKSLCDLRRIPPEAPYRKHPRMHHKTVLPQRQNDPLRYNQCKPSHACQSHRYARNFNRSTTNSTTLGYSTRRMSSVWHKWPSTQTSGNLAEQREVGNTVPRRVLCEPATSTTPTPRSWLGLSPRRKPEKTRTAKNSTHGIEQAPRF